MKIINPNPNIIFVSGFIFLILFINSVRYINDIKYDNTSTTYNKLLSQKNVFNTQSLVRNNNINMRSTSTSMSTVATKAKARRNIHRSVKKNKPIMYTYVDRNDQYVDEELLKIWIESWRDADWDVKILTLEDAKTHANYKKYNDILTKHNICCVPAQTYLRHIAMSTLRNGGFYTEPYVFPLRPTIHAEVRLLPNEGNFTSYDGIFGTHMSGSYEEWNRMTNVLIMDNIDKNVVLSLQKIYNNYGPNVIYIHEHLVSDPNALLTNQQFTLGSDGSGSDFCKEYENYSSIRFHPNEIQQNNILDVKDSHDIISSWLKVHKARCWGDRPVVFTFYEPVSYLDGENPKDLLEVWETFWSDSGWEPVVLTLGDAKRHPDYKKHIRTLEDSVQFGDNRDKYNYLCFVRWLAMAASGGGLLADYDTFPLKLPANHALPNNGSFTGHAGFVPNLMSGSASEWNRMSKLLFNTFSEHNKKINEAAGSNKKKQSSFYSDLYATKDLLESSKLKQQPPFIAMSRTAQVDDFYVDELLDPQTKWRRLDPYDFKNKCVLSNDYVAIHFSHYSCSKMWFCREGSHQDLDGVYVEKLRRSEIARKWLDSWKVQCQKGK